MKLVDNWVLCCGRVIAGYFYSYFGMRGRQRDAYSTYKRASSRDRINAHEKEDGLGICNCCKTVAGSVGFNCPLTTNSLFSLYH